MPCSWRMCWNRPDYRRINPVVEQHQTCLIPEPRDCTADGVYIGFARHNDIINVCVGSARPCGDAASLPRGLREDGYGVGATAVDRGGEGERAVRSHGNVATTVILQD